MINTQNPFFSASLSSLSKFKSTSDTIYNPHFIHNNHSYNNNQSSQNQNYFNQSLKKNNSNTNLKQNFTCHLQRTKSISNYNNNSRKNNNHTNHSSSQQLSLFQQNSFNYNIAKKLSSTLKNQRVSLQNLKKWSQSQKNKVQAQLQNLCLQIINFISKFKTDFVKSIDSFYLQMLKTYEDLKKISRELYITKKEKKIKFHEKNKICENQILSNYGLIKDLQNEQQEYIEFLKSKNFVRNNHSTFLKLSYKIDKISNIIQSDILKDLNIQMSLKQFQNHLYSLMRKTQQKLNLNKLLEDNTNQRRQQYFVS